METESTGTLCPRRRRRPHPTTSSTSPSSVTLSQPSADIGSAGDTAESTSGAAVSAEAADSEPTDDAGPDFGVPESASSWIKQHAQRFLDFEVMKDHRTTWTTLIHNWVRVEEAQDFQTPQDGFSATGRPAAIGVWIQNARKKNMFVPIESRARFLADWFDWWEHINPEWRERDGTGCLILGGDGAWDGMFKPGKCGFLLVLECLVGLHQYACVESFEESLKDVEWTVDQVLRALNTRYVVVPLSHGAWCS